MQKALIFAAAIFFAASVQAADYRLGALCIESPWARAGSASG